jgi:hypothetical protein
MEKATVDRKAISSLIKSCFFFMLAFCGQQSFAQTRGKVQVIRDPLFDTLLAKRAELNRTGGRLPVKSGGSGIRAAGGYISSYGYRVQIYSGSNRTAAFNAQAKFNQKYPEMRTYIIYREPNFKVKAGDFRSRLEAERMKEELRPWFSAMFIIPEKINPPKTVVTND